ncbi:MAG: hypothetical protein MUO53_16710 [Maribacter sp.]|nr:hypothetical protein [Maribacter sp.]
MKLYKLLALFYIWHTTSYAQVLVKDEPRHKNVFENEIIRVLDVRIQPGDTTLFHIHKTPSLFVVFTNTSIGSQLWDGPAIKSDTKCGDVSYESFFPKPRVHRVWNSDTNQFHVIDIEIIAAVAGTTSSATKNPDLDLTFDTEKARGYGLKISSKKQLQIETTRNPILLVVLSGKIDRTDFNRKSVKMISGSFHWVEKYSKVKLENKEENQMVGYAFEIKL